MASQSLCNGERAVVLLFISAILFSTPSSLFSQALFLFLLAIAALFLDIRLDNSNFSVPFKTRPGASSGIFLGAVTLPAVMISRLIQLSRAFSLHEVGIKELGYLKVQYWATSASCFGVLIFIFLLMRRSPNNSCTFLSNSPQGLKFSSSCIVSCAVLCCVSFAIISYYGLHTVLLLLWVLFHGVAAAKLIQHVLNTFPSCASIGSVKIYMPTLEVESLWQWFPFVEDILLYILSFVQKYVPHKGDYHFSLFLGEALLVTSGLVLYFGDMLGCTIAKIDGYWIPLDLQYGAKRSEISTIIQGVVLGLLLFPIFFKFLLQIWEHIASSGHSEARACNEIGKSLIFHTSLAFILIVIIPSWMQFVLDFHMHPLLWIFKFVFSEPLKRLSLCIYWVGVIYASILRFYNISKNSKVERILLRKYYHLMAVSMFLPAVIFQPKFLDLAFGAALAAFLTLEIIRVWRIWPLGQLVHQFMNAFTDHRDSNLLVVSHFSLLLGCALPIWMSSGYNDRPLAPFAGILSLGIGDTMASMVGHKYGVLRWSKTGKKTIEGTAAGITSVLVACSILLPLLASTGYILTQHWVSLLLAVTASGLLEAYTAQLDNAFIPLIFYSLLCL